MYGGFIEHQGKTIVFLDISNSQSVEDSMRTGDQAKAIILAQPPKSVLMLTDVTGAHYNIQGFDYTKRFSQEITPHVRASAMVGITGVKRTVYSAMARLSGRNIKLFDDREVAKNWLAGQG